MMVKRIAAAIVVLVLSILVSNGQESITMPSTKTKLESAQAKTGSLFLRNLSQVGSVKGVEVLGGSITIDASELVDVQTAHRIYGLNILIYLQEKQRNLSVSYIDYEEIPSLVQSIDNLCKLDMSVTKLNRFEGHYISQGQLDVCLWGNSEGIGSSVASLKDNAVISLGGKDRLLEFKSLLVKAKALIDQIKPAR